MSYRNLPAIALTVALLSGCSATPPAQSERASDEHHGFERPGWADQSYTRNRQSREHYFTGLGYGATEADARQEAQSDAVAQFAHHLGAEVVAATRIRARASTPDSTGIEREQSERTDYTGIASDALLQGARFEFAYNPKADQAWARLMVRDRDMEKATRQLEADYQRQARQRAAIEQQLVEQRLGLAEGEQREVLFAKATGTVVVPVKSSQSLLAQEQDALERARYRAIIELNSMVNGESMRARMAAGDEGELVPIASSISNGRVFWEPVAERVWGLGDDLKAQVTLFGWSEAD